MIRINQTKVWVVKNVEGFCPELKLESLVDRKVPSYREIHLPRTKPAKEVPGSISCRGLRAGEFAATTGRSERLGIDGAPAGDLHF